MTGKVKKLVRDKGFGFIRADNGSEYFFHFSGCESKDTFDSMNENDQVSFEPIKGMKGERAENVRSI